MRAALLDSDVVIHLHGLGLLVPCLNGLSGATQVLLTGYVARHELSSLATQLKDLEEAGTITVHHVLRGTPASRRYREFQQQPGVDKGEAEAIAWALHQAEPTPVFCTGDAAAKRWAEQQRTRATDTFGLLAAAIRHGSLDRLMVEELLAPWNSPRQQRGRPADYRGFEAELAHRSNSEGALFLPDP